MPDERRLLSIAAGTLRDVTRLEAIEAAAAAGFGALGLRFDLVPPTPSELRALRRGLDDTGLSVLDVEVVRLSPEWDETLEQRLVEWAHAVGARHLLVVSDDPDRSRALDGLRRVSERCDAAGLSAVLEFMRFTHPKTLGEAVDWVREMGPPFGGILVDPLHLARSGGSPADLGACPPEWLPYAQLCDAPAAAPSSAADDVDADALIEEARHARRLPGDGELPLRELIRALPRMAALSVEVQSNELERSMSPIERADAAWAATTRLIESV